MPNLRCDKSKITIVCEGCGQTVEVRAYYEYTPKFCSAKCANRKHNKKRMLDYCTIEGCQKPNYIAGLCQMHHWRKTHYGDPMREPYTNKRLCTVKGCGRKHAGRGLCALHLGRQKRGLPMNYTLPQLDPKRYRILTRRSHPLANAIGRVYEHRMVLFDSIGFLRVPCFWCGAGLVFGENLCVDHLNHNRQDNRLQNLVPTCNGCNAGRTVKSPRVRESVYSTAIGG